MMAQRDGRERRKSPAGQEPRRGRTSRGSQSAAARESLSDAPASARKSRARKQKAHKPGSSRTTNTADKRVQQKPTARRSKATLPPRSQRIVNRTINRLSPRASNLLHLRRRNPTAPQPIEPLKTARICSVPPGCASLTASSAPVPGHIVPIGNAMHVNAAFTANTMTMRIMRLQSRHIALAESFWAFLL
uniref:hypothetical protein n=1 Tax=Rothia dentocariosa TaxID=2047 RepID=UPI003FA3DCD8